MNTTKVHRKQSRVLVVELDKRRIKLPNESRQDTATNTSIKLIYALALMVAVCSISSVTTCCVLCFNLRALVGDLSSPLGCGILVPTYWALAIVFVDNNVMIGGWPRVLTQVTLKSSERKTEFSTEVTGDVGLVPAYLFKLNVVRRLAPPVWHGPGILSHTPVPLTLTIAIL